MTGPIFIGSIGRTGSTLLSLMLDSHYRIKCGPELHFRGPTDLGGYILGGMLHYGEKDVPPALKGAVQFVARCERLGIEPAELKKEIQDLNLVGISFFDRCRLINNLCKRAAQKAGKKRWGIKIMNDIQMMHRYQDHWPDAVFIDLIRHPVAAVASLMAVKWGPNSIEGAVDLWRRSLFVTKEIAIRMEIPLFRLRFEDLVGGSEDTMREMLDWLEEDWDPNVLRHSEMPHTFLDTPKGHPSAKQVAGPLDASYATSRKDDLTFDQKCRIMDLAGDMARELEYGVC